MNNPQKTQEKLWSKNFICLVLVTLFAFTVRQMIMSSFPLFVTRAGGNAALAGSLTLFLTISSIIARVFSGPLTDRLGRRKMMIGGASLYALAMLVIAISPVIGIIAAMQVFYGIGMSALTTASGAAVADVTPPSRLGEGMGYYTLGNSIAMAIGPSLGIFLIGDAGNYRNIYICSVFLLAITTFLCWNVCYDAPKGDKIRNFSIKDIIEPSAIPAGFILMLVVFSFTSVIAYISSYAKSVGINGIGSFFTIYALGMIVVRLFVGKIVDKFSERYVVIIALTFMSIAFFYIAKIHTLTPLMIIAFILGLGQGAAMPALQKAAIKNVTPQRRGAGNSTYQLLSDVGTGFGAALWGILVEYSGFTSIYYGASIISIIGIILTVLILDRRKNKL